jgi:hypothetical protein
VWDAQDIPLTIGTPTEVDASGAREP